VTPHASPSPLRIAPSILSADFARLGEALRTVESAGADWVHVDVMDGHFVPNLTLGPPIVRAIRRETTLPFDVHLMVEKPETMIDAFADAGADTITVHVEACPHLHRTLQQIRARGKRAGVALCPATSEDSIRYVLGSVDLVLVMSVNPGFGGQAFLPEVLPKARAIAEMIARSGRSIDLEMDGGIAVGTANEAARAGVRVLVAGQSVFHHPQGVAAGIRALRDDAQSAIG
jgi:ribulose-phosphate 3-epimerase